MNLIALRSSLKSKHCQVLIMCQFNAVGGRVRVRSSNFRAVSALDRRCSWAKVAILLYQYLASAEGGSQPSSSKSEVKFQGRKERFASDLSSKLLKELELEAEILCTCEQEIIASLKHYHRPDSFDDSSDEVMQAQLTARGEYLSKWGKMLMKMVIPLSEAVEDKKGRKMTLTPGERQRLTDNIKLAEQFSKLETSLRELLLKNNTVFNESTLPDRRTTIEKKAKDGKKTSSLPKEKKDQTPIVADIATKASVKEECIEQESLSLTSQDVFKRLCIDGINEVVMAYINIDFDRIVPAVEKLFEKKNKAIVAKQELEFEDGHAAVEDVAAQEVQDAQYEKQDAEDARAFAKPSWHEATLRQLRLPHAHVEVSLEIEVEGDDGKPTPKTVTRIFEVRADKLRPKPPQAEPPKPNNPTKQAPGQAMETYNLDYNERRFQHWSIGQLIFDLSRSWQSCSSRVRVYQQSMKGHLPVSLQCRALDAFAIGELVLVPGSDFLQDVKTRFPTSGKKTKAKEIIHSAMMSKVHANFYEVPRDGRCKTDAKSTPPAATVPGEIWAHDKHGVHFAKTKSFVFGPYEEISA